MKCYARTLCLRDDPEAIRLYKEHHLAVWTEVLAGLRMVGIQEMKIFLRDTRMFMYLETDDSFVPERDFPRSQEHPRVQEWEKLMGALQTRSPEARAEEWWADLELVFDLNWPQHRPERYGDQKYRE